MRDTFKKYCPPLVLKALRGMRARLGGSTILMPKAGAQDLDVYWDPVMAALLETWGEGNAWNEIQLLMAARSGRVLDIACGTGKTIEILAQFPALEVHGCDISDMLLQKATARGIAPERLMRTDATTMGYTDMAFNWGYSIGSLEHFTEDGIDRFLKECHRVVSDATFHMIPVSRNGLDNGWIKTFQSYHNNSVSWWQKKCEAVYPHVYVMDSVWSDEISLGKWLVCSKVA
jgi:SAM-dependent methyltransferase